MATPNSKRKLLVLTEDDQLSPDSLSNKNRKVNSIYGPPLELWEARSYVLHWLRNHTSAEIPANRSNDETNEVSENEKAFYKILN